MLDLSRLSAAQRQAVLAGDGPLLIIAGPGSGKTTVLAARIAYLVTARSVGPTSVLAITFTTAAARELRQRLTGLLGEAGRTVDVATFHAFGLRIVRQWSEELGLGPGPPAVYGEAEARTLLAEAAAGLELDPVRRPFGGLAAELERYRLGGRHGPESDVIPLLAETYELLLRRRRAVDYPAMLALPLRLFRDRPQALRVYQDAYRWILCDEFQDLCAAQYTLLRLLAERHRNLVVVGDPRQNLYGWRGASTRFLREFRRDFPEARLIGLDQNFRSTGRLVDLANAVAAPLSYHRPLWTDNPPGRPAHLYSAADESAEAAFVATEVERLCAAGAARPGEVAVLYRTNQQAHELALALRSRHVPYRVRGSSDLFARREVRDAVAYLRLAHNPADAAALARIANVPPRRLGRLAETVRRAPVPASELPALAARLGPAAAANVAALVRLIAELQRQSAWQLPSAVLDLALAGSGYRDWLVRQPDGAARLAHLAELRRLAGAAEGDLAGWLADLQLGEDVDPCSDDSDGVLLTTIHRAKGGEWRVVFVVGLEEGLLPHRRSLASPQPQDTEVGAGEGTEIEAELRVAYVPVTRPRQALYLTWCRTRRQGAAVEQRRPSRFLRGLPANLLARAA